MYRSLNFLTFDLACSAHYPIIQTSSATATPFPIGLPHGFLVQQSKMNATSLLIQVFDPRVLRREVQCRHAGSLYPARSLNARTYISGKLPMSDTNCIQWYRYRESIHPRDRMYTCSTLDQPDFEARENAALAKKQNPELAIHQARTTRYIPLNLSGQTSASLRLASPLSHDTCGVS